jgi:hypothetical protein
MESKSPRSFSSMSAPGLTDEARKAVNAAFDAMSTWRTEIAGNSEKNIENVIDKMAAAARALGWPEQIVEATRTHMQRGSKMQIEMMDQLMDAWEAQIKSPGAMASFPSEMMSKLQPGPRPAGSWPYAEGLQSMANPFQFWAQVGEQWQKNWADAMATWTRDGRPGEARRR